MELTPPAVVGEGVLRGEMPVGGERAVVGQLAADGLQVLGERGIEHADVLEVRVHVEGVRQELRPALFEELHRALGLPQQDGQRCRVADGLGLAAQRAQPVLSGQARPGELRQYLDRRTQTFEGAVHVLPLGHQMSPGEGRRPASGR